MGLYDFNADVSGFNLQRLMSASEYLVGDGQYATNRFQTLGNVSLNALSNGLIDLSNPSGLITVGSIPPSVTENGFAATATATSINWFWDGTNGSFVLVIRRTDQSRFTVPGSNINITGLTANTWYGFLPDWANDSACRISWVQGTAGTPQIAHPGGTGASFVYAGTDSAEADALAQQLFQGREQLSNGWLTFKTPASGTSSGGGSYDGGTDCVMVDADIETLGDLPYSSELMKETHWQRLVTRNGRSLNCTRNHPLYSPEKKQKAEEFKIGDWVVTQKGEEKLSECHPFIRTCTKRKVKMQQGHIFFANGFMSHNVKA